MLDHPTHDLLRQLKLDGMADAFTELQSQDSAADMGHAEWLGLLIDREVANRTTKRFQSRLRAAKLRHGGACIEDVDFRAARRLDKALFQQLAAGRWIKEKRNLLITGPCGVGKTWLACALGQRACRDNATVIYKRLPRLFSELQLAHDDGQLPVDAWHDIIDEPTFADAILDRLIHNAHRLPLEGPSMRKTRDAPATKTVDEQSDT